MKTYFYAQLNDDNICTCISQLAGEISNDKLIPIPFLDSNILNKLWEFGEWEEVEYYKLEEAIEMSLELRVTSVEDALTVAISGQVITPDKEDD